MPSSRGAAKGSSPHHAPWVGARDLPNTHPGLTPGAIVWRASGAWECQQPQAGIARHPICTSLNKSTCRSAEWTPVRLRATRAPKNGIPEPWPPASKVPPFGRPRRSARSNGPPWSKAAAWTRKGARTSKFETYDTDAHPEGSLA